MSEPETRTALEKINDAGIPEYRSVEWLDFEVRNDGWGFDGLGGVYEEVADLGAFTEEVRRGSYRRPLAAGNNVRLVYDHSPEHVPVLATIKGGTMKAKDDARGVRIKADIAQHYMGEAARELIKRGDIRGMSPGFVVGRGNSTVEMRDGRPHRTITNFKRLIEFSITPDPAYAGTAAEMRSMWALQMAESLGSAQHVLMGAYPQPENRAQVPEADTGDDEAVTVTCETCAQDPCACEAPVEVEEQRAGVDSAQAEAAARRRRLQMLGMTLPR